MQDKVTPEARKPQGEIAIRTFAMPENVNPGGDIFGGWIVSNMDIAGVVIMRRLTKHKFVTVAIDEVAFLSPVRIGDLVCIYAAVEKIGRSSVRIRMETWASSHGEDHSRIVTEGVFTYVAVDETGKSTPLENQRL